MKGIKMENDVTISYLTKVHEIATKADALIETYLTAYAMLKEADAPAEAIQLTHNTLETLTEMKAAMLMFAEHTAQVDEKVEDVLKTIQKMK
jgi:hypothetical protein